MGDSAVIQAPMDGVYTYQVYLSPYPGWWRRWRGRVITRDEDGQSDIWAWRSARTRAHLLTRLWDDVQHDLAGRRGGATVQLSEVTFRPG